MPQRLRGPCKAPGCPGLATHHGYCDRHADLYRPPEDRRPSARRRGYSATWDRLRAMKLARDPLCEVCKDRGLITPAAMVHHKVPITQGGDPLPDLDGLESLCLSCHGMRSRR